MGKFKLVIEDEYVSICYDCGGYVESFIDIFIDDIETPSPIKNISDAITFAEIILKLLEAIYDFKRQNYT